MIISLDAGDYKLALAGDAVLGVLSGDEDTVPFINIHALAVEGQNAASIGDDDRLKTVSSALEPTSTLSTVKYLHSARREIE